MATICTTKLANFQALATNEGDGGAEVQDEKCVWVFPHRHHHLSVEVSFGLYMICPFSMHMIGLSKL